MEKSNIQLECRLWVWSWASARTVICASAHRFRNRMMSKQAVHTNSKFPRPMGKIKSQTRVQAGRIYSVEKLNWMLTYTQWMAGEWSNTYRLRGQRQLPDGHHLECRCANCRAPASCQRVGIACLEEACSTVGGVGAPLKAMSGACATPLGLEFGICARAPELYNSDRAYWAVHTDSTCPAQVEKSNVQLECRLWVWSRASARTLSCTTAL